MFTKMQVSTLNRIRLYDILEKRKLILKASTSKRQIEAWRGKWKELQELEMGLEHITTKETVIHSQSIHPCDNKCSSMESMELELVQEFHFSQ